MDFRLPEYYENREISWLKFNERILGEARTRSIPLFERLKFLSITSSNLDEFFMVRVASLKDQVYAGCQKKDISGLTAKEQLIRITKKTHDFVRQQYITYNRSMIPMLKQSGLRIVAKGDELSKEEGEYVDRYFKKNIYPVLTPMAVDSSRPFPLIRNKTLNIGALLKKKEGANEEVEFATVQVPSVLNRVIELPPNAEGMRSCIFMETVIMRNMHQLFLNYDVICASPYRVMRNADLPIQEDEAKDLLTEIEKRLKQRQSGEVIRLEAEEGMDKKLLRRLRKEFGVKEYDVFNINGPLDLTVLMKLYSLTGFEHLKMEKYIPAPVNELLPGDNMFEQIQKGDILLHHPYQTFEPVIQFVRQAAADPDVLAIKQTLYRVSGNSPIIAALEMAAENGKQVSVLVELKARFDEENNIGWAKKLEKAGCHVIYGLRGLKTHGKIILVVRREEDGIRRYVHLGTGNYNDSTAKLYTDLGLLTCREPIGEDATAVFNMLSGYSEPLGWNRLSLAPLWLKKRFLFLIRREKNFALAQKPAYIIAKMNSLCDPDIIEALYDASSAGVKINLLVRGICCLKTGIKGVSETIHVRSIVGDFLEHSRVFCFGNNKEEEIYMASADWMPRNLDRRVEIMFPVEDVMLKKKVKHILEISFADNVKAHVLKPDGTYEKIDRRGKERIASQAVFKKEAWEEVKKEEQKGAERSFQPLEGGFVLKHLPEEEE